jgi:hypothetical protein
VTRQDHADDGAIAFGIMCKAPIEGASKTRLCPPLTPAEAAQLSRCFIADVADAIACVSAALHTRGFAVFTPAAEEAAIAGLVPPDFGLLAQRGADLGERLQHASEDLLGQGFAGVCLINSDSPTLPVGLLTCTVEALRRPGDRVVLGPAIDGGYTLIAAKAVHPPLFAGIAWSTAQVLAQTLARIAAVGLPAVVLPVWYDVDDAPSLHLLMHELFAGTNPLAGDGLTGSSGHRSRGYLEGLRRRPDAARLGFAGPVAAD